MGINIVGRIATFEGHVRPKSQFIVSHNLVCLGALQPKSHCCLVVLLQFEDCNNHVNVRVREREREREREH